MTFHAPQLYHRRMHCVIIVHCNYPFPTLNQMMMTMLMVKCSSRCSSEITLNESGFKLKLSYDDDDPLQD